MSATRTFELSYWVKPGAEGEAPRATLETLKQKVTELGGTVVFDGGAARRRPGYPIQKQHEAYFGGFKIELPADAAGTLQHAFDRNENILRVMIARVETAPARPRRTRAPLFSKQEPASVTAQAETEESPRERDTAEPAPESSLHDFDKRLEDILKA